MTDGCDKAICPVDYEHKRKILSDEINVGHCHVGLNSMPLLMHATVGMFLI